MSSYGSFNTLLEGAEFDSGTIDDTNGTRLMIDAEDLHSDGYLTNMAQDRQNIFSKLVQPLRPAHDARARRRGQSHPPGHLARRD